MNIKNVFVCSENQELRLDGAYKAPAERGGWNRINLIYSNYFTCKNCKHSGVYFKKNYGTIIRYIHEVTYKTERLISSEEIKEYNHFENCRGT